MPTIATAFWRRLDVPGRDAARVTETAGGHELFGQATFLDPRGPTTLRYVLDLAPDWSTREGRITGFIGERTIDTHIVRTQEGWTLDGKNFGMPEIVDLDLGFSPATNMIQLRRVALAEGEEAEFDVAWLEAGDEELIRLPQKYRRVSQYDYDYHSPQGDYHATIVLAASGFASVYPGLWKIET
jgi:hypothetical protein